MVEVFLLFLIENMFCDMKMVGTELQRNDQSLRRGRKLFLVTDGRYFLGYILGLSELMFC